MGGFTLGSFNSHVTRVCDDDAHLNTSDLSLFLSTADCVNSVWCVCVLVKNLIVEMPL